MRPAPPLALQCAPSRSWRLACALIGAAAAAAVAAWAAEHQEWALPVVLALAGIAATAGALVGVWIAGPPRRVEVGWDGRAWHVDGRVGDLHVMLDSDRWLLLLRHRPRDGNRARWVALSFAGEGEDLRTLRTALYSPPPDPTPDLPQVRAPDRATD
jgi:hypothetical protein